jgi:hypothetical protein
MRADRSDREVRLSKTCTRVANILRDALEADAHANLRQLAASAADRIGNLERENAALRDKISEQAVERLLSWGGA